MQKPYKGGYFATEWWFSQNDDNLGLSMPPPLEVSTPLLARLVSYPFVWDILISSLVIDGFIIFGAGNGLRELYITSLPPTDAMPPTLSPYSGCL